MDLPGLLLANAQVDAPVLLVAAHPDDEVLGLGSRFASLRSLAIVHLTDGAPRDLGDARREGFPTWAGYAAARRRELRRALAAAGAGHARTTCYGYPDQQSVCHVAEIVARLARDLAGVRAVLTHPYEHGHPDHDTAALAVRLACERLRQAGFEAPERYEFASYHLRRGQTVLGEFWPDPEAGETELTLSDGERRQKRAALACFVTQRGLIAEYPVSPERVRPAPAYDFTSPAPPGDALYDLWGWAMTSREWRRQAEVALARARSGEIA